MAKDKDKEFRILAAINFLELTEYLWDERDLAIKAEISVEEAKSILKSMRI